MKIEIHKENGISRILLDGTPVERGCVGFEVSSAGAGFATVTLKFLTKDLDLCVEVGGTTAQDQESSESTGKRKRFH